MSPCKFMIGREISMARDSVQLQKGISLNEFLSRYGTEDQCFDALYRWRWPNGFVRPHCGHNRCCQLNTRKLQQCNRCHRQSSITAGTVFDSTKLPLTVWFQAIYLMTPGQERRVSDEAAPPSGRLLQRRVADPTRADAGDDGARPPSFLSPAGSSSTTPISVARAVVERPARLPSWPPTRPARRDNRCA